jgi:Ni/Co efflux regulator RcnB
LSTSIKVSVAKIKIYSYISSVYTNNHERKFMKPRLLFTLVLTTLFTLSLAMAQSDKAEKKAKKSNMSCCAQKTESKADDMAAKPTSGKEDSQACCDMDKASTKDGSKTGKMDCCGEHDDVKSKAKNVKELR